MVAAQEQEQSWLLRSNERKAGHNSTLYSSLISLFLSPSIFHSLPSLISPITHIRTSVSCSMPRKTPRRGKDTPDPSGHSFSEGSEPDKESEPLSQTSSHPEAPPRAGPVSAPAPLLLEPSRSVRDGLQAPLVRPLHQVAPHLPGLLHRTVNGTLGKHTRG